MMDILNYAALRTCARTLMTAPAGAAVQGVLDRFHELEAAASDAGLMAIQSLQYESYLQLKADAYAMTLNGMTSPGLAAALHGAEVLEELREGTVCDGPTGEDWAMDLLEPELREEWYGETPSEEGMEELVFATVGSIMSQTWDFPLAVEMAQGLLTYQLAAEVEKPEEMHPRRETGRTVKLAKYAIPWERRRSTAYLCGVGGEVFLLDGNISSGS